jgi:transposase InsO family protein
MINLYSVAHEEVTREMCNTGVEVPFQHTLLLLGPQGEIVRVAALFDGCAMVAAMCISVFEKVKHRLGEWKKSERRLRMGNGMIVPSLAVWKGRMKLGGVTIEGEFEVFDSGGSWAFLLGKPLLHLFQAKQSYGPDTVSIRGSDNKKETLYNQIKLPRIRGDKPGVNLTLDVKQCDNDTGGSSEMKPPPREVSNNTPDPTNTHTDETDYSVYVTLDETQKTNPAPVLTREHNPNNPERVRRIVQEVTIGPDVTHDQRQIVEETIREYADCFALSMKEVNTIPGAIHRLNIPEGATFRTKITPRSYNPDQRAFIDTKVDEMLEAGIIRPIHPSEVKFVAQTVLAQKAHDGQGLPIKELKHIVNEQCLAHNIPDEFNMPPNLNPKPKADHPITQRTPVKWRLCQDFGGINKVTEVAPVPQGDIRAKQLRLSGHRYVHIFDFAAGFYGIAVHPDSQPYITFFVEGRGYFAYQRMPFGVTGGPSEFGHVTGERFHDLIAKTILELFVDDGGMASDSFEEGMKKLRVLLDRVRREKMSLSPSKLKLFMTEAVFAGAQVGPQGVSPDSNKLTAIVNWPVPEDASHLEGFLGLTSYFRDLVKGYAQVEGPLRNLLRQVPIPAGTKKHKYQQIMKAFKLKDAWTPDHTKTFINLKARLISEPVLSAPVYDGTPFILTTDGSKDAFAGVLSQRIKSILPGGKEVTRLHPIAFASKRTSSSEEKYKPFLLEFAALKYSFDKFSDIVYGYPVEVETDCQALRDVLMNDKLSATHARWRDGVLAHNIVDVRHIPGVTNIADGLSRQYENTPKSREDGSEWDVEPDWETGAGLVYGINCLSIPSATQSLRDRFATTPLFRDVIDALEGIQSDLGLRERKRARHRAARYMIEGDKLWFVGGGTRTRAVSRRECVTKEEAMNLARTEHEKGGHFHRDLIKIALLDKIHTPSLDQSIVQAIADCPRCKNFGGTHLHALLQPITRRHPFELLVGDYLSMPTGKGGYHTVGLYLDTFTQHIWGYKFKTAGTGKTTVKSLEDIYGGFAPAEVFMSDGGKHFKNNEVRQCCERWGGRHHVVAAYSPWINGLVEGTNRILLYVLARLCAPEVGEDGWQGMNWTDLPKTWPDHFDEAIQVLNWRILPALKFSPKELLLSLVVNTNPTPLEVSSSIPAAQDFDIHMAYAAQQKLDGYAEAVRHAMDRKTRFDRRMLDSDEEEVVFEKGQLVQVYRNDLAKSISSERKLTPMWSEPHRVLERLLNSYKLETITGQPMEGEFHARRLRAFTPREGTELAEQQREIIAQRVEQLSSEGVEAELEKEDEGNEGEHRESTQTNNEEQDLQELEDNIS